MGARAQVQIGRKEGECVFLYTHWGAGSLIQDVQRALARRQRWEDDEYLARIVFDEMRSTCGEGISAEDVEDETGYGISTQQHGDIELLIALNPETKKVSIHHIYQDDHTVMTFEDFLNE